MMVYYKIEGVEKAISINAHVAAPLTPPPDEERRRMKTSHAILLALASLSRLPCRRTPRHQSRTSPGSSGRRSPGLPPPRQVVLVRGRNVERCHRLAELELSVQRRREAVSARRQPFLSSSNAAPSLPPSLARRAGFSSLLYSIFGAGIDTGCRLGLAAARTGSGLLGADDAWTDPRDLFGPSSTPCLSESRPLAEAPAAKIFGCKRNRLGQRPLHNVMRARTQLDKNCLHTRLLLLCLGLRLCPSSASAGGPCTVGLGLALRGLDLEGPLHELQKELHLPLVGMAPLSETSWRSWEGGKRGGVSRSIGRLGRKRIGLPRVSRA